MFTAEQYRAKATEYAELLKFAVAPDEIIELQRRTQSFTLLAQNEDWLAHNSDKIIRAQDDDPVKSAAAKITGEPRGS
jgi:uncharacterized protein CbrC (UPF0167 family)